MQPPEELSKVIEAEIPAGEVTVSKPMLEEPVPIIPIIESSRYESPELEKPIFEKSEIIKEPVQTVAEQETAIPQKVIVKEIKEVPVIPIEKLDMIINGINEISQTLKELKSMASGFHLEIKDMKKDQKEMNVLLKDIKTNFKNIKTKKSWFSFS
jgi:hypothetical protein